MKDIDDRVKLNAAIIELQEKILAAQEATSEARVRLRELEADFAARDAWQATASRYALKDYGGNTFAYELLLIPSPSTSHIGSASSQVSAY